MKIFYKMLLAILLVMSGEMAYAQYSTGIAIGDKVYPFIAIEGSFGTKLHYDNLTVGDLTLVKDIKGSTFACDSVATDLRGKIAIIDRGYCNSFVKSCLNVAKKGAIAILVANIDGAGFGIMGGSSNPLAAQIKIPCLMIQKEDGDSLKMQVIAAGATPVICGLSHPNNYSNDAYEIKPGRYTKAVIEQHIFAGLASIFPETGAIDSTNAKQAAFFLYAPDKSGKISVSSCKGMGDTNLHVYETNKRGAFLRYEPYTNSWSNEGDCPKDKSDINNLAALLTDIPVKAGNYYYIEFDDKNSPDSFYFDLGFIKNDSVNVTFNVDMYEAKNIDAKGIHIAGNFQGWDPAKTKMDNVPGTKIYTKKVRVASEQTLEYKFVNGDAWGKDESVANTAPCASGKDGNRKLAVLTDDIELGIPCFSSCDKCLIPNPDLVCNPDAIICDPFKTYALGSLANGTATHWSTWNDAPAAGPVFVTSEEFTSDTKALRVDGAITPYQDIIFKTGNQKSGHYKIQFKMLVPTVNVGPNKRSHAYYSFQHDITGNHVFGAEIYFFSNGQVSSYLGSTELGTGNYKPNQWMTIVHDINIDKDTIFSDIGGFQIGWKWSKARTNVVTSNKQLAGMNFYVDSTYSKYFIDDIQLIKIPDPNAKTKVTFSVDMANETVDPAKGVCIAGSFQKAAGFAEDWKPGITKLINKPGTSLWELTLEIPTGNYEYKFINDEGWNGKEEKCRVRLVLQAITENFPSPMVLLSKWGHSATMSALPASSRWSLSQLTCPKKNPYQRMEFLSQEIFKKLQEKAVTGHPAWYFLPICQSIYATSLNIPAGTYEYKFLNGNAWGTDESVPNTASCAAGKDGNRKLVVGKSNVKLDTVCFRHCVNCSKVVGAADIDFDQSLSIFPNPTSGILNLNYHLESTVTLHIRMLNLLGQVVYRSELPQVSSGIMELDTARLPEGTYMLEITDNGDRMAVKKFVVVH